MKTERLSSRDFVAFTTESYCPACKTFGQCDHVITEQEEDLSYEAYWRCQHCLKPFNTIKYQPITTH